MESGNFTRRFDIATVIVIIRKTISLCHAYLGVIKEKDAGCLTIISATTGSVFIKVHVNEIGDDKYQRYTSLSEEKTERLYGNLLFNHLSSFQSRNEVDDRWAGAILAGDFILGFSGMPELIDEVLMLVLAIKLNLLTVEQAKVIAALSANVGNLVLLLDKFDAEDDADKAVPEVKVAKIIKAVGGNVYTVLTSETGINGDVMTKTVPLECLQEARRRFLEKPSWLLGVRLCGSVTILSILSLLLKEKVLSKAEYNGLAKVLNLKPAKKIKNI